MRSIAITNNKGGVGKTTTAFHLGVQLSGQDRKVLLIDLDPQNALTSMFFEDRSEFENRSVLDVLRGRITIERAIVPVGDYLHILASDYNLDEFLYWNRAGKELLLRDCLEELQGYEYVIMDCPPTLDALMISAVVAAQTVLIPARLEGLDIRSVMLTLQKIGNEIVPMLNPRLTDIRVVPTNYLHKNRTVHGVAMEMLREHCGDRVSEILIPQTALISQVNLMGVSGIGEAMKVREYRELAGAL